MKIKETDANLLHLGQFYISLCKANRLIQSYLESLDADELMEMLLIQEDKPAKKAGKPPRKGKKNGKRKSTKKNR